MGDLNEKHWVVGLIQLVVFLLSLMLVLYVFFNLYSELKPKEAILSTISNVFSPSKIPEEKTLLNDVLMKEPREQTVITTTQTIDFKSKEIWVTDEQMGVFGLYYFACILPSFIFVLVGIGKVYAKVREITAVCIEYIVVICLILPFFIVLLPLALAPFAIAILISTFLMPITLPIGLIIHIIGGTIQLYNYCYKKRN